MNLIKAIVFLLCSTLLVGQTTPIRNPQIQGASGAIISGATLTNSGTFVNSGTMNGAGTFDLSSGTVTLPATVGGLASWIGVNSITTLGTITTGTWNATPIGVSYGGSGQTSLAASIQAYLDAISTTQGTVLYNNGTDWVALAPGTSGQFLKTQGAGANPAWGSTSLSGLADVAITAAANNDFLVYNGAAWVDADASTSRTALGLGALATLSEVGSAQITDGAIVNADINASAAIAITKLASSAITIAGTSTSLGGSITASTILDSISSTQGTILYRGASGWSALSPGTSGYFLKTQGAGANPMWDLAAGSGSVATDAIWDAAGDLVVGTGANTAARLAIGTSGYVLTSNGTTAAWAAAASGISGLTSTRVPFATGATTLGDDADLTFATDTLSGTALKINVTATTAATSSTTGALIVAGGIGANKDSWINGIRVGRGGGSVNSNTALGAGALAATATGTNNVGVGENALAALLGGGRNMMIGHESGNGVTSGSENAGAGNQALYTVTTGNYNSGFGATTLAAVTTASGNTALGYQAGTYRNAGLSTLLVNPSNSIYIGDNAIGNADSETNAIVIGSAAIGEGSNKTVIGNSSTTSTRIYGALSVGQATGTATAGKITLNGSTSGSVSLLSPAAPTTYTLTLPSADAAGVFASNGVGAVSIIGTTAGGNGTADSGKIALLTADGGINLGKLDVDAGDPIIYAKCNTGVGVQSVVNTLGTCFFAYPLGSSSTAFHAHVQSGTTGDIIGFEGDMTGGTGTNYFAWGVVRTGGLLLYGTEQIAGVNKPRIAITATGNIERYANGTTFLTGSDKTIVAFETPSGTNTATVKAWTGSIAVPSTVGTTTTVLHGNASGQPTYGSVILTTDTTGNYVADVAGTSNEITSTHTPGEGSTATLSLPSAMTFTGKTVTGGTYSAPTLSGAATLAENASIALDPAGSADGKYSGTTVTGTAGATLAFGDVVVLDVTDSRWELADANSAEAADGDARAMLGICVLAAASDGDPTTILLHGIVRADTAFPTLTVGAPVYVGETAGDAVVTQPTTANVLIRMIGHALTGDEMFFNPDNSWMTHL